VPNEIALAAGQHCSTRGSSERTATKSRYPQRQQQTGTWDIGAAVAPRGAHGITPRPFSDHKRMEAIVVASMTSMNGGTHADDLGRANARPSRPPAPRQATADD
jgi:hypothetical protein